MNLQISTWKISFKTSDYKGLHLKNIIKNWDVLSKNLCILLGGTVERKKCDKKIYLQISNHLYLNQSSINQLIEK